MCTNELACKSKTDTLTPAGVTQNLIATACSPLQTLTPAVWSQDANSPPGAVLFHGCRGQCVKTGAILLLLQGSILQEKNTQFENVATLTCTERWFQASLSDSLFFPFRLSLPKQRRLSVLQRHPVEGSGSPTVAIDVDAAGISLIVVISVSLQRVALKRTVIAAVAYSISVRVELPGVVHQGAVVL